MRDYRLFSRAMPVYRGESSVPLRPTPDSRTVIGIVQEWESGADDRLDAGASVRLKGRIVSSKGAGQARELLVKSTEVIGTCDPEVRSFISVLPAHKAESERS